MIEQGFSVYDVVIIGSGFGGQIAAINLRKRGLNNFLILERRDFLGGTWVQNKYPGAAVDVQSPLYSLSFEPYPWTQMYAEQPELEDYTNKIIEKYGLREQTRTGQDVQQLDWCDDHWQIQTKAGDIYRSRSVISASGPLSQPLTPEFPGHDAFQGEQFHTNAWNHDFDHKGKRVAIIGNGASAAQVIPAIASEVEELHVFQRSPHWVLPRHDWKFGRVARTLLKWKPMYQLLRKTIYWALEYRVIAFKYSKRLMRFIGQSEAERFMRKTIKDPELRKKLTPDYLIGCKRILVSSTLYPALQRDNVSLHDRNDSIARITESGIETAQGIQLKLDAIVYATGYQATDGSIPFRVTGRDGKTLEQFWEEFPRAYLGTSMPGFPNLYLVTGPNTGIGHTSALFIIESQMKYILRCLQELQESPAVSIEVKPAAEEEYTDMIHREMRNTVWQVGGCNSWYKSKSGRVIAMYPGFSFVYRWLASRFKRHHHQLR